MSQLGRPGAAVVEAVPMRNECEGNLFVSRWRGESQDFMKKFSLLHVRNVPLANLNKGLENFLDTVKRTASLIEHAWECL